MQTVGVEKIARKENFGNLSNCPAFSTLPTFSHTHIQIWLSHRYILIWTQIYLDRHGDEYLQVRKTTSPHANSWGGKICITMPFSWNLHFNKEIV